MCELMDVLLCCEEDEDIYLQSCMLAVLDTTAIVRRGCLLGEV